MKKYMFVLLLTASFSHRLFAQMEDKVAYRAGFVELGGPSIVFTFNYDFRFDKTMPDGLGLRAGIGGYAVGESYEVSVPVMVNYLAGKRGKYFEAAGGAIFAKSTMDILFLREKSFPIAGAVYLGYRIQPADGGFVFRAGLPFIFGSYSDFNYTTNLTENRFFASPWYPGVSFGYAF